MKQMEVVEHQNRFTTENEGRASIKKKLDFLADKKTKKLTFFAFFIHIPIEPECSEIDNFYINKNWLW